MKKFVLAAVALSAAATSLMTTPAAQAGVPVKGPEGFRCGYFEVTDPNPEAGNEDEVDGDIYAGPATTDEPGTLVCTIRSNPGTHAAPGVRVAEFRSDRNGVIVGVQSSPGTTTVSGDGDLFLCTAFRKANGTTIYHSEDVTPRWHTDPGKACSPLGQGPGTGNVWDVVDGTLCSELARDTGYHGRGNAYIDVEGDVFVDLNANGISEAEAMDELLYDCPRYTFATDDWNANPDRDDPARPGVIDRQ